MATPGRKPNDGLGKPPGSGRKPGQKNRLQVTEDMRKDILLVYKRLGGVKWLLTWAKANPDQYVDKVLARIMPAVPREEPMVAVNVGIQADNLSLTESAMRVAFLLNAAANAQGLAEPPVTESRIIEALPEPMPEPTVPTLPPSQEPLPENNPPLDCYRGSRLEQDRPSPGKRVVTRAMKRNLL